MTREILIGAHMSVAGGLHRAFERGLRAGCRAVQIFLKNSNQWQGKPLTEEDCSLFKQAHQDSGIGPVLAHSSYLINLASPDKALHRKSVAALMDELTRANSLGIRALILHPGAHKGSGEAAGISAIAAAVNQALRRIPPPVEILLENTAGQGSFLGHCFEQLASVFEKIHDVGRIGFCLDTCHAFAAGYDIRTEAGCRRMLREFDRRIGVEWIKAFHLNDCRKPLGRRVDLHTHIGQGFIGLDAFRCIVNDRRFRAVPKIIETPKGDDLEYDLMNLGLLRSLGLAQK